jgi:hypothetical protein
MRELNIETTRTPWGTTYWDEASPNQKMFHSCMADEVLYGGAAGGGKSRCCREDAWEHAWRWPGSKQIIMRRTNKELRSGVLDKIQSEWPLGEAVWVSKAEMCVYFANKSKIELGYMDLESDKTKYQSSEYGQVHFDEATHFEEGMATYMVSRARSVIPGEPVQVKYYSNPGNVGHAWVKKRFKIGASEPRKTWVAEGTQSKEKPDGMSRCFIPSRVFDNKVLMRTDPAYVERLRSLPEVERKMLLDGDWDIFAGQAFPEWRYDVHVCEPFPVRDKSWRKWACMDWGGTKPFAVLWMTEDWDRNIYIYRELYGCKHELNIEEGAYDEGVLWTPQKVGRECVDLSQGEGIKSCISDPSIWNRTGGDSSIATQFSESGWPIIPGVRDRQGTKMLVHHMLKVNPKTGLPKLRVFSNCRGFIRTFPQLTLDPRKVEDVNTKGEDHIYDALREGLKLASLSESFGITFRGETPDYSMRPKVRRWRVA